MMNGGGGAQQRRSPETCFLWMISGVPQLTLTELEHVIKTFVTVELHVATAVKVMAYLAFIWSTVVLLGGYVSLLQRKDFQFLTVITVIQAYSIFNDMDQGGMLKLSPWNLLVTGSFEVPTNERKSKITRILARAFYLPEILFIFYLYGPVICICISSWRLRHRAYAGASNGEASIANLTTALDFFYALVLCQGVLAYLLMFFVANDSKVVIEYQKNGKNISSELWFMEFIKAYINDARERCAKISRLLSK
ncbi:hypothetical protein GUJ93_ZPchr0011g27623 [Zizania palustris]|uniref:Uncharacterized protein n=1 Tax=Zizania palustris TaxID=103762 RepID=A0A8J5WG89_ZIZPA|nr:hypothetical protein GUJ93_ZPchr0011g27623 [Zizania palustris]